ncbi:MAG: M20/M25/M40 family metallo-hydrolase [Planctomycetota bacterium]
MSPNHPSHLLPKAPASARLGEVLSGPVVVETPEPTQADAARCDASDNATASRWLDTAVTLLEQPTASFHEQNVANAVIDLATRAGYAPRCDAHGNVLVDCSTSSAAAQDATPLVLSAHMDHPGFWAKQQVGRRTIEASWVGRVPRRYFQGAAVRFHSGGVPLRSDWPAGGSVVGASGFRIGGHEVSGQIVDVLDYRGEGEGATVLVEVQDAVEAGSIGQWLLPGPDLSGGRLRAAAIDDVAGVAALVCVMQELARAGASRPVTLLFTRAEEAGFLGCTGYCRDRAQAGAAGAAQLVGVEMSMALANARVGDGPVVRVGDRRSVFDPGATSMLLGAAERLVAEDSAFAYQRRLMTGGTCESSVFQSYLGRSGAVCLAMGNYHNVDAEHGRLDREYVDTDDFVGLVRLLCGVAQSPCADGVDAGMQTWFENLWSRQASLLFDAVG